MLDDKGRCCGHKPVEYKRDGRLYCDRCQREYDIETHEQTENWEWIRGPDGEFFHKPRLYTPCCETLRRAMLPCSDHEGYGPLVRREGNEVKATWALPAWKWCPWCGRSLEVGHE